MDDRAALTDDETASDAQTALTDGVAGAGSRHTGAANQPPIRSVGIARGIDVRQPIVNEFLESSNLEANSRRAYEGVEGGLLLFEARLGFLAQNE